MATSGTYGVAKYGDSQYGIVFVTGGTSSYTLSGGNASFLYNQVVVGSAGAYAIAGQNASLQWNQILNADAGSYAITGGSATFVYNQVIYAGNWNFQILGQDAGLLVAHKLSADAGAYSLTGGVATLQRTRLFTADAGAYTLTGKDATLTAGTQPVVEFVTKGGVDKKVKTPIKKSQRDDIEAIVRRAFDEMDGTAAAEVAQEIRQEVVQQIKQIDLHNYNVAISQVNALILQAQTRLAEYEAELDDEESILMLL